MIPMKIHREAWDFPELSDRWGFKRDRDMRRLVMAGAIKPFATFRRELQPVVLLAEEQQAIPVGDAVGFHGELWLAQELAIKVDNFECIYPVLRDQPEHGPEAHYFEVSEPIPLTAVLVTFVVSDANRAEVERSHNLANEDCAVSKRQERTRDVMIVAMAHALYGWEPGSDRSTGATELMNEARAIGFALSYPTIRQHLRLAWERCPPTLSAEGDKRSAYQRTAGEVAS